MYLFRNGLIRSIGCLTKDQEVADIWTAWELLSAHVNLLLGKFETFVCDFKLHLE